MTIEKDSIEENYTNRYEKIFGDAKKSLDKFGDIDFLDEIPDDSNYKPEKTMFPYGRRPRSKKNSEYSYEW